MFICQFIALWLFIPLSAAALRTPEPGGHLDESLPKTAVLQIDRNGFPVKLLPALTQNDRWKLKTDLEDSLLRKGRTAEVRGHTVKENDVPNIAAPYLHPIEIAEDTADSAVVGSKPVPSVKPPDFPHIDITVEDLEFPAVSLKPENLPDIDMTASQLPGLRTPSLDVERPSIGGITVGKHDLARPTVPTLPTIPPLNIRGPELNIKNPFKDFLKAQLGKLDLSLQGKPSYDLPSLSLSTPNLQLPKLDFNTISLQGKIPRVDPTTIGFGKPSWCIKRDYTVICPEEWTLTNDELCRAPSNYNSAGPAEVDFKTMSPEERQEWAAMMRVNWPCVALQRNFCRNAGATPDFSQSCPRDWDLIAGVGCVSRKGQNKGICQALDSLSPTYTESQRETFAARCQVEWPCNDEKPTCDQDYSVLCPEGYTYDLKEDACNSLPEILVSDNCQTLARVGGWNAERKRIFSEACRVSWPCATSLLNRCTQRNYDAPCPEKFTDLDNVGFCILIDKLEAADLRNCELATDLLKSEPLSFAKYNAEDRKALEARCGIRWPCIKNLEIPCSRNAVKLMSPFTGEIVACQNNPSPTIADCDIAKFDITKTSEFRTRAEICGWIVKDTLEEGLRGGGLTEGSDRLTNPIVNRVSINST